MEKLKIGVLGAGHLGKIHIKLIQEIDAYELVGFYDPDTENAANVASSLHTQAFSSAQSLIEQVQVVDIVTPTLQHYPLAKMAIEQGKHVFVEKPLTTHLHEAEELVALVQTHKVKAQVGHVERFNPAFLAVEEIEFAPVFIETHRLAMFNPRGTDVSVVMDLMIHDLDIIASLVQQPVKEVRASGVPIISSTPDIANARIEFQNGCIANVTASRLSLKNMRKTRIFQPNAYVSIDFLEKKAEIVKLSNQAPANNTTAFPLSLGKDQAPKYITFNNPQTKPINAIKHELSLLANSILTNTPPKVPFTDGHRAMHIAHLIQTQINNQLKQ